MFKLKRLAPSAAAIALLALAATGCDHTYYVVDYVEPYVYYDYFYYW